MRTIILMALLGACGDKDGGDGSDGTDVPVSEILGSYNFMSMAATGCTESTIDGVINQTFWVDSWAYMGTKLDIKGDSEPSEFEFVWIGGEEAETADDTGGADDTGTVSEPGDLLSSYQFYGAVTENEAGQRFGFSGEVVFEGNEDKRDGMGVVPVMAVLTVEGTGSVKEDEERNGCWVLNGDLVVNVNEFGNDIPEDDCKIEVPFRANQVAGSKCDGNQ